MLSRIEQLNQRTLHLVAPPGSGKTIVGLEVVRRGAGPAVVFAPTTTIAGQWADKVSLFTDDPELARETASNDPRALSTINVFTYQRISSQDTTDDGLETAAVEEWCEQLVVDGQVPDAQAATARIEQMREDNPERYRRQVRSRVRRLRRQLIEEGGDVESFLHPNARALIDAVVDLEVATIVLDECHHLLDHWALVVRALIDRLPEATVVGLTATPPDPDDRPLMTTTPPFWAMSTSRSPLPRSSRRATSRRGATWSTSWSPPRTRPDSCAVPATRSPQRSVPF